jgi:replicative DNA helicase
MIAVCTASAARCYEEQGDVKALIDDVEKQVFTVAEDRVRGDLPEIKDHVNAALDAIELLYKNRGQVTGVPTGYKQLDNMTNGLHPSEMIVIAARPSMGKTALAMNIAEHVAVDKQIPVAVFSLEMSSQQLATRLLCSRARVNLHHIRNGIMPKNAQQELFKAVTEYSASKMVIDDTAGLSINELRAKSRRLMDKHGLGLIVIDYLQLLKSPSKRGQENRQIEIAEISNGIKALAKELTIPIIVLAQLNRKSEDRGDGKPRISDLRESGSIEQDADVVGLLYRSAYYAKDEEEKSEKGGEAELIIAKQRNGPTGEVPLTFLSEFTRFESRDLSHGESEGG